MAATVPVLSWLVDHYVVDLWSLYHLAFWAGMFLALELWRPMGKAVVVLLSLLTGYGWEVMERYLERLHHARWTEPFLNRWVSDPFFDVAGAFLGWLLARWLRRLFSSWLRRRRERRR